MTMLQYDWRQFEHFFSQSGGIPPSIGVITDKGRVVAALSEGEDTSSWLGFTPEELRAAKPHLQGQEIFAIDRQEAARWLASSKNLAHFQEQSEFLKKQAGRETPNHFLMDWIQGKWSRFFPNSYGVFVRLTQKDGALSGEDIFFIVRGKSLDLFHEPELHALGKERMEDAEEIVRYLSEKHMIPVQGLFVPKEEWRSWSIRGMSTQEISKQALRSLRKNRSHIFPKRMGLTALLLVQSIFGGALKGRD